MCANGRQMTMANDNFLSSLPLQWAISEAFPTCIALSDTPPGMWEEKEVRKQMFWLSPCSAYEWVALEGPNLRKWKASAPWQCGCQCYQMKPVTQAPHQIPMHPQPYAPHQSHPTYIAVPVTQCKVLHLTLTAIKASAKANISCQNYKPFKWTLTFLCITGVSEQLATIHNQWSQQPMLWLGCSTISNAMALWGLGHSNNGSGKTLVPYNNNPTTSINTSNRSTMNICHTHFKSTLWTRCITNILTSGSNEVAILTVLGNQPKSSFWAWA